MKEQTAYIGKHSLNSLSWELSEISPKRVFLVRGKESYESCGAKAIMDEIFDKSSVSKILVYSDFSVNPEYHDLQEAISLCKQFHPDLIIAIGGGSAIDMAKLVRFFLSYNGDITKNEYDRSNPLIPLIAMPTTSGTGAEATHFAVLYKDKVKYSVEHDEILPDIAVVYSPFTYKNSPYLTACTGFDAFAQGIEAYWNKNATEKSDKYAERAIGLIYPNLPLVVNSPTEEARDKMAEGAYWAGRAINITKTTAPHAFSYPFTSYYGYPHGHAVALTFPYFASVNIPTLPKDKKAWLSNLCGFSNKMIKNVMLQYLNRIGLILKPKQYDIKLLLNNINANRLSNNPVQISRYDVEKIIKEEILKNFNAS